MVVPPAVAVVGGGPAGLSAAWELARAGRRAVVYEMDEVVGGISRTVEHRGFRFDLGGHRFFTKVREVRELWHEILADDLLERPRLSRIFHRGHFFDYPLKPLNALSGLGALESLRVAASFARARLLPRATETSFEDWVTNRFGSRLYEVFFKTYTEKVWGMPCSEISADWAAQRIRNLDLGRALRSALFGGAGAEIVTTLIQRFHYPRHGPGMMWERCARLLGERGTPIITGAELVRIGHRDGRVRAIDLRHRGGRIERSSVDHLICSIPLGSAATLLDPPPPATVLEAADGLRHRDFLTVVLFVDEPDLFPDNWIYIHAPEVRVGRIQNFKNWSPEMVPDPARTALGLEYFVQRGDDLWRCADDELIALGSREVTELGLAPADRITGGTVVRVPRAYPIYDSGYRERVATVRGHLETLPNLQMIGRNGQHRYNNQDHSMVTGLLAARNVLGAAHDIWDVNVDGEYHEETGATRGDRLVPGTVAESTLHELIETAFRRFDPVALGAAVGVTSALGLFLATAVLLLRGGEGDQPMLSLLGSYLLGYHVSWPGALLGLLEGGLLGTLFGAVTAHAINALVALAERSLLADLEAERRADPLHGAVP